MIRWRIFSWVMVFLLPYAVAGQYFSTGQDPASLRWKQLTTPGTRLIFPESFEPRALYLAKVAELTRQSPLVSLKARVPQIPWIIHPWNSSSNGVTVWAPRRIELYPNPPDQSYPQEWLEQLVLHEYRHAVQISSVNRRFSRVLRYLFGEQIIGGILGLYVPAWFLEGDATVMETALSQTGRGRSPLFESTLRAQLLEKEAFSYDKATLGSYRTFTPDAYSLGYYLVAQSRARYGAQTFAAAFDRIAGYPFMVVPFNSGIRKSTGLWKSRLYRESMRSLDSAWRIQAEHTTVTSFQSLTKIREDEYVVYHQPQAVDADEVIAEVTGLSDIPHFVRIDLRSGKKRRLKTPGIRGERTSSLGGGLLVYAEIKRDARWHHRSFSELRVLNLETGKRTALTRRTRLFSPDITPDGKLIAAVEKNIRQESSIVLIDPATGVEQDRFPLPDRQVAMNPAWSKDGKILFVRQSERGQALACLDPVNRTFRDLTPPAMREINGKPEPWQHYILFSSAYSGITNIYALDTNNQKVYQATGARFAATAPSISTSSNLLLYTNHSSGGTSVVCIPPDTSGWISTDLVKDYSYRLFEVMAAQEGCNIQEQILKDGWFRLDRPDSAGRSLNDSLINRNPVKKFNRAGHLFHVHSWAPVSLRAGNLSAKPGVMALSQNLLSTMTASAGWEYDLNEETGSFYAEAAYEGWYVIPAVAFNYGNRAGYARYEETGERARFTWQESALKIHLTLPLQLSGGAYSRSVELRAGTTVTHIGHHENTPENFTRGTLWSLDYLLAAAQYRRMAHRDLYPRIGQRLELNYRHSTPGSNNMGYIVSVAGRFYFPGIFRHHSLSLYCGLQEHFQKNTLAYTYGNLIITPRGYHGTMGEQMASLQGNYALPLLYPDFSAGSILYLKRFKMNLFCDYGYVYDQGNSRDRLSTGAELIADFHLLRFPAPLEAGLRAMYHPREGLWGWEFVYAIGLP